MARLLVLAAAALLIAYLLSEGLARLRGRLGELIDVFVGAPLRRRRPSADRAPRGARRGARRGAELVACAVCGVHVPRSRAILAGAKHEAAGAPRYYCSEACRRGAASRGAASRGAAA